MATTVQRKKGVQKPSRYPIPVGARYKIWGEQPGFIYNPYQDQYVPDIQGQTAALQGTGVLPKDPEAPKEPGIAETLLPIAGAQLANEGGKLIGKEVFGGSGLFGLGGNSSVATPTILNGTQVGPAGLFSSFGSAGTNGTLGIGEGGFGGPILGAVGMYDVLKNKRGGARGVIQGGLSGAAAGSYFGPPGAVVGGVIGAGTGLFNTIANRGYSDLEDRKRKELAGMGYTGDISSGDGAWENNADFAQSRDESKLRGEDILNAADWLLKYKDRWGLTDRARQIEIANEAIKRGLVREHNGGIDIDTSGLSDFVKAA